MIQEKLNAKRALLSDISNRLPDYPLGDDGEVEESGKGSSGSKRYVVVEASFWLAVISS